MDDFSQQLILQRLTDIQHDLKTHQRSLEHISKQVVTLQARYAVWKSLLGFVLGIGAAVAATVLVRMF